MFSTSVAVITWPTSDFVVCTSGDSAVTLTVSFSPATFIVTSTLVEVPTWTCTSLVTTFAKPVSSATTSYVPGGRNSIR